MRIDDMFSSWVLKGVGAVALAVAGFASHVVMDSYGNSKVLESHTQQIQKLWEGQKTITESVQQVNQTVIRIDGKIDVINQKIDDDREANRRPPPR